MKIKLAYGKQGLPLELPDHWHTTVVEPAYQPALPDQATALRAAFAAPLGAPPLRDWARPGAKIGIVFSDITRPTPNHLLIPAVLAELTGQAHVPPQNIVLFNSLGTHRPNTDAELRGMLGDAVVDNYRIVQNDAFDPGSQVQLGHTARGSAVWLNREFVECDLHILTGFIEPHFFAGFSGGGKAAMPGMAGQRTVLNNHGAALLADSRATWGVTHGNPVWEEIHEVALKIGPIFLANVTLNRDRQITGVFAGNLDTAHAAGCQFVKQTAMAALPEPFDIVITTNSGYPLDLNLYQTVKGMSAAAQIVRQGGTIIAAAECWDGIPEHGLYGQLLRRHSSPQAVLESVFSPGFLEQDQWQVQIQAQIQLKADVYVYTTNLTRAQIEGALFKYSPDIRTTVEQLLAQYGPQARICVLPEGPQTVPYIQGS